MRSWRNDCACIGGRGSALPGERWAWRERSGSQRIICAAPPVQLLSEPGESTGVPAKREGAWRQGLAPVE